MPCWLQKGFGAFVGIGGIEGGIVRLGATHEIVVFSGFAVVRWATARRKRKVNDVILKLEECRSCRKIEAD